MLIAKRNNLGGAILPYARRLAYLQGTGSQWMDIPFGFPVSGIIKIEHMFDGYKLENHIIGSEINEYATRFNIRGQNNVYRIYTNIPGARDFDTINLGVWRTIEVDIASKNVYLDGAYILRLTSLPSKVMSKMALFALHYNSTINVVSPMVGKIADVVYGEHHYIPVMSHEGNPEMYDEVSGTFAERHGDFLYGELDGGGV